MQISLTQSSLSISRSVVTSIAKSLQSSGISGRFFTNGWCFRRRMYSFPRAFFIAGMSRQSGVLAFATLPAEGRCVQDYFFGTGLGEYGINRFPGIFNKIFIIKNICTADSGCYDFGISTFQVHGFFVSPADFRTAD